MPLLNLQVKQFTSQNNRTYLFYRYKDDANNNWEYQVYELVQSTQAARDLGAPDNLPERATSLNTREMCDWVFNNISDQERAQ